MGAVAELTVSALAAPPAAKAKPPDKPQAPASVKHKAGALAPLPAGEKVEWSHGPFEAGDCSLCHKSKDPKNPGPIVKPIRELCLSCHEEFEDILKRKFKHPPAEDSCTNCHNPHNSKVKKLLLENTVGLCEGCHPEIDRLATKSKTKHQPVTTGAACSNCHNPHAANVEHLLVKLPFDLCVGCHSTDDLEDNKGKKLTNFKKLLDENPNQHAPVASKDCSACHRPHASENFRLLTLEYPAAFYAPFDPKNYALCFDCHNDQVVAVPTTTKLTRFRDGDRNLHFVHVNKEDRGRTCRACHDVHASKQPHHIRESVPYGPKGWALKVGYTQTPTGGSCAKTCHATKSYENKKAGEAVPPLKKK